MVDLNKCKKGDKLRSKHGIILTYVEKSSSPIHASFPHLVRYPNDEEFLGAFGSRTDDGHVYCNPEARQPEDHDIVEIIPKKEKPLKLSKKTKVVPTLTIICVWEVIDGVSQIPKAFYGNDEKKVVKAANEHFCALMKESGYDKENDVQACLDDGGFDNGNTVGNGAYEIIFSWAERNEIK